MVIRYIHHARPAQMKQMLKRDIRRNIRRAKHGLKPLKIEYRVK